MIYELAIVEDCGTFWKVTNVTKNTIDSLANREEKLLKLSYMSYQMIQEALLNNKAVHIQKSKLRTDEVLPGEFTIIDSENIDELKAAKDAALTKVRMLVTPELSKISSFALYGFIVLNNDLINEGFAITNGNREEKYLEILETGNEQLISKLEDYLNYKDEIESIAQLERKFSKFKSEIKLASNVDQVKEIENKFLENFYSYF